jgi:hypothetical protein
VVVKIAGSLKRKVQGEPAAAREPEGNPIG